MKRLDPSAFRVRQAMILLEKTDRPLTKYDIANRLDIPVAYAKSLLDNMRLAGRAVFIKIRRTRFYGPVK